ncbi:hypothetical protein [Rickettsia endosymbiont of Aspidapion aeneum]
MTSFLLIFEPCNNAPPLARMTSKIRAMQQLPKVGMIPAIDYIK